MSRFDRAICDDDDRDGFLKLTAKQDGTILGATMVGRRAGEAFIEIVLAIQKKIRISDLASVMQPYPTYSTGSQLLATEMATATGFVRSVRKFIRTASRSFADSPYPSVLKEDPVLEDIALISLAIAFACAVVISIDEVRHPQKMWIMNLVWPITALYLSVFAVFLYFRTGRSMTREAMNKMSEDQRQRHREKKESQARESSAWHQVAMADTHCGAGCALADIITESAIFAFGITLLGSELWASFLWDFVAAWTLGIAFQYFTLKPMRNLSVGQALWEAVRADTFSILTFQIGMYLWMAFVFFKLFPHPHLHPNQPTYWLMMQIGMIFGFVTAYPMNLLFLKTGWKEAMG